MMSLFLMELMVDNLYNWVQLVFMVSVYGILVVVFVMVSPTCSDCDPARALAVNGRHHPAYFPISWQR